MLSTEVRRIVLLVALGVLGYALAYTWTQDFGRQAPPPVVQDDTPFAEPIERTPSTADAPIDVEGVSGADGGVPTDDDVPVDFARRHGRKFPSRTS